MNLRDALLSVVAGAFLVGTALAESPAETAVAAVQPPTAVKPLPIGAPPTAEPGYIAAGKRDPFRPFTLDLRPQRIQEGPVTPLQKYELGQLKVAGVVLGVDATRAMVEDSIGMGYIVSVGTPMGRNGGIVKAIEPGRIVVEEHILDYYGQEQLSKVVLSVPSDDGGGDNQNENQVDNTGRERR